jgi:hypothetical protein
MVCLCGEGYLGEQLPHFQPSIQLDHTGLEHAAQDFLKQAKTMEGTTDVLLILIHYLKLG